MGGSAFDTGLFLERLAEHGAEATRTCVALESVDSTSAELARRLGHGAPVGTVVVAGSQTHGRGRSGRDWCSPPGGNLYLSVAVAVPPPEAGNLTAVPLAAGLAAVDALAATGLTDIRLKWPNDLLVGGRKLGGILCEAHDPRSRPLVVIVGIGVNLSDAPLHADLAGVAISAPEVLGRAARAEPAAAAFVAGLERLLDDLPGRGRAGLVERWKARAEPFGRRVVADGVAGTTVDLDRQGRLLVRGNDGRTVAIAGGIVEGAEG